MEKDLQSKHLGYRPKNLSCSQCASLIDISSFKPLDHFFCPQCNQETVVPAKLGIYEICGFLGRGAMGRVYLANDPLLHREVAIKILRENLSTSPKMWALLEQEGKIAAGITHANVIQIYTMGKILGRPYIVMELANYASLYDLMAQGLISEALATQIAIDVIKGLRAAYQLHLIHGDIKPANILITSKQHAKITDFGLARYLDYDQEVERWGTPYYIAPEKSEQLREDFRSDLYSLGATLFHAMAGYAPYEGKTGEEVISKSLKSSIPKLHKANASISKEMSELIFKLMRKNPDDRFWSFDQALACFEDLQENCYKLGSCKRLKSGDNVHSDQQKSWIHGLRNLIVDDDVPDEKI
ncbi:serine/threonine-protein kinase [Kiritimatiellota bacterium B12222]|nr:serine/threonine-protein kinase [Kiritimatiellota bacterium B12222]